MHKLLIITNAETFLLKNIIGNLEEAGSKCKTVTEDVTVISNYFSAEQDNPDSIVLFVDETAVSEQEALIYIKDKVIEEDIPLFLIEGDGELEEIKKSLSDNVVTQAFARPLNVKEIAQEIVSFIEQYGTKTKKKILVVDDSGAMLRNVKGWLGDKYHVILANSGAMAIKYLSTSKPDLVLLDYEMPITSGKQVLEMIRSEPDFASVPVIFLTSKNDKQSIMDVLALKPEGYLLKTLKPEQIVKEVDDFFAEQAKQAKIQKAGR